MKLFIFVTLVLTTCGDCTLMSRPKKVLKLPKIKLSPRETRYMYAHKRTAVIFDKNSKNETLRCELIDISLVLIIIDMFA